jgi:hypothetical protein
MAGKRHGEKKQNREEQVLETVWFHKIPRDMKNEQKQKRHDKCHSRYRKIIMSCKQKCGLRKDGQIKKKFPHFPKRRILVE